MNWYLQVVQNPFKFDGRARRMEYWMFNLVNLGIAIALMAVGAVIRTQFVYMLYSLLMVVPSIAVSIRRMHDTGRSGWTLLLGMIPLINLVVLFFLFQDSQPGDNQYGPNPKSGVAFA